MDGQEGDVVVEASESGANVMTNEVRASGREQVSSTLHALGKGVLIKTHSNGSHLSSGVTSLEQDATPVVHLAFPVIEALGEDLREVVLSTFGASANLPHVSPLHVHGRREGRLGLISLRKVLDFLVVVSGSLDLLWSDSYLEVELRLCLLELFSSIELVRSSLEVSLHEVNVVFVVFLISARVLEDEDAVVVEAEGDLLALAFPPGEFLEVEMHVDDWHLVETLGKLATFVSENWSGGLELASKAAAVDGGGCLGLFLRKHLLILFGGGYLIAELIFNIILGKPLDLI